MLLEFHTEYELAPGGEPDAGVKLIVPLPLDEFKQTEVVSNDIFPGGDDIKVYEADSLQPCSEVYAVSYTHLTLPTTPYV